MWWGDQGEQDVSIMQKTASDILLGDIGNEVVPKYSWPCPLNTKPDMLNKLFLKVERMPKWFPCKTAKVNDHLIMGAHLMYFSTKFDKDGFFW